MDRYNGTKDNHKKLAIGIMHTMAIPAAGRKIRHRQYSRHAYKRNKNICKMQS